MALFTNTGCGMGLGIGFFGWTVMLLFWGAIILLIIWLIRERRLVQERAADTIDVTTKRRDVRKNLHSKKLHITKRLSKDDFKKNN